MQLKWLNSNKQEQTTQEEQSQILERAAKFDRLLADPGWLELQNFFAEQINSAIVKAADDDPLEAEKQRLHVIQWNAKRELNDGALAYIAATRRERDRILTEQKEQEKYVNSYSYTATWDAH